MNVKERDGLGLSEGAGVTLLEAKERWYTYTRKVLTNDARKSFRHSHWEVVKNEPCIFSMDGRYAFVFRRRDGGHIYAQWLSLGQTLKMLESLGGKIDESKIK